MEHILSILVSILTLVLGCIGFLLRGWFKHVNDNLTKIWEKLDAETQARESRWGDLSRQCSAHGERIARVEAVVGIDHFSAKGK